MIRAMALLLLTSCTTVPCLAAEWAPTELGETAIVPMAGAPYPHESRAEGYTRNETIYSAEEHYTNSDVAIFLPRDWDPDRGLHLLFYFHGHGNNVRQSREEFHLREQIVESRRNVILIFPQGPFNAPDSGGGRLEEPGAFAALADEVLAFLREEDRLADQPVAGTILSGHSGAFRVIAHGAMHGGLDISEIYLLDASYGYGEEFAQWAAADGSRRLRSIFTDHLAARNAWLVGHLNALDQSPRLILEEDWSPEHDAEHRLLFMHTTLTHGECVRYLGKWLGTSSVPTIGSEWLLKRYGSYE